MKAPLKIWLPLLLIGLAGAGLMALLLVRHGITDIAGAFAAAGWAVALVVGFHIVPLMCTALV